MIRKKLNRLMLAGFGLLAPILVLAQDPPESLPFDMNELAAAEIELAAIESFNYQSGVAALGLVTIIIAALVFATIRERRKQELFSKFAEQGNEIPAGLLPPAPSPQREMRRGVWLLSLGLGLGLTIYIFTGDWDLAAWSLILLFLGAASFVNAAFFYPKSPSSE